MAVLFIVVSYLLGSIPSAYIAGRLKGIDIRKAGDGNVGAANAYREVGPVAGIVVIFADVFKGVAAIALTQTYAPQWAVFLAGLAAVAGHIWPVYIGFKGGRGEATAGGVLVTLLPYPELILLALAIIPFIITRNTMLLGGILFAPLWLVALLMGASMVLVTYSIALPCVVGLTHFFTTRHLSSDLKKSGRRLL